MEKDEQQKPKVSRSFLFSFLIVAAIIGIVVFLLVKSSAKPYKFENPAELVERIEDQSIRKINVTESNGYVSITGEYVNDPSNENEKSSFILEMSQTEFKEAKYSFSYDYNGDGKLEAEYATLPEIFAYRADATINFPDLNKPFIIKGVNAYEVTWWDQWGPTLIMLGGSILLCVFLFSRLANSVGSSNNKALDFNRSRARKITHSKIKFDDVAGADEEKEEMKELVSYLKEPTKYTKYGAKLPKGVLLVGPPGCGKTLLAKAVAGEAGVPFYTISGSDFVEMFVGVGAGRVRDMFKIAKQNAPCLVFIDEIDAVGRQRGAGLGGGNDEREQTLNQLLVEMDGFNDNSGIIVIAATNRDDVLDPALLRAGRFDRKITVSLPDNKGREEIFKVHARKKKISSEVDFTQLAKRTVGFSGADIENIMNEAAILAVRKNKEEVTMDEIDEAVDRRVAGPAKTSRSLSKHEKEIIAYHEAGHAIIGLKYPHSDKVQKITIIPRGNTGGHVRMTPEEDRFLLTKNELLARIVGYLGGRSSEETFFDDVSSGAQNDIEVATQIARMMVCELGMSPLGPVQYERDTGSVFLGRDYANTQKNFSVDTATKIDAEIRKIIDGAHEAALKCIKDNKDDVILLAKTLIEHEQITAEEIDYLLKNRHLKRDEKNVQDNKIEEPKEKEEVAEESKETPKPRKPRSSSTKKE